MNSQIPLVRCLIAIAFTAGMLALAQVSGAQNGPRVGSPAPEITGVPWINSEPLSMEKLRGRVVFVEFWTFG